MITAIMAADTVIDVVVKRLEILLQRIVAIEAVEGVGLEKPFALFLQVLPKFRMIRYRKVVIEW